MKIQTKLLSGYLVISVLVVGLGVLIPYTLHGARTIVDNFDQEDTALGQALKLLALSRKITTHRARLLHSTHQFILTRDPVHEHHYDRASRKLTNVFNRAINKSETEDDAIMIRNLRKAGQKLEKAEREMIALAKANRLEEARALLHSQDYVELNEAISKLISSLANIKRADSRDEISRLIHSTPAKITSTSVLLVLVISSLVGILITHSIARSLRVLRDRAVGISEGSLDQRIAMKRNDEIGELSRAFDVMAESLQSRTASRDKLLQQVRAHKQTVQAMKASEAKYRDLYDNDPIMHASIDSKMAVIHDCNHTLAASLGYKKEEIIGRSIVDFYHPDYMENTNKAIRSFVKTGKVKDADLQLRRKDGSKIDVNLNANEIRDVEGNVLYSRSSLTDITERKAVEQEVRRLNEELERRVERRTEELRAANERFHTLFEQAGDAMFLIGPDGHFVDVNGRACEGLGYTREELMTLGVPDIDPMYPAEKFSKVFESFALHQLQSIESVHQRKDGSTFLVEIHVRLINIDGKKRLIAVVRDVTERKRAESRIQQAVESTPNAMVMVDERGKMVLVNEQTEKMFGYDREELLGQPVEILVPDIDRLKHSKLRDRFLGKPKIRPMGAAQDFYGQRKDGTKFSMEIGLNPIKTNQGRFVMAAIMDNTEQKLVEAELRSINHELEAFAYSVSHDLRAPLRSIDGFSQALLEDYGDRLDEEGRDLFHRIRRAAQQMAQDIDDLLELSRLSRAEMRPERVDLSAIAREINAIHRQRQPQRHVELVVADNLVAKGDPKLLRVVLENLLNNAWKFTGKHPSAKIEFGLTQHDGAPAYFVRDDGAGFKATYADKLFGAFQRLHSAEEFEGTGVGLATVQRVITRHGGRVWAEGEVEKGATFYFTVGR